MNTLILLMPLFCAAAPPVETSKTPETMLYVRTTPEGAEIILDDQPLGTSPGLFKVPAGVRRIVVELEGHEPNGQEVTIKAGQIKRMTFKLEPAPVPVAEQPRKTVGKVVTQLLTALADRDIDKLEALFLPPADTPAGRNRRAYLDHARAEFSDPNRKDVRMAAQTVRMKAAADGQDRLLVMETLAEIPGPDGEGWVRQGQRALEFRITPTKEGGRIAEVNLIGESMKAPPSASAGRADEAPQRAAATKTSADPVSEILRRFEAALNERNIEKLEALFLPLDDTQAGKARRKHVEAARGEFSNPNLRSRETAVLRLVRMKERQDGKDKLVEAAILLQFTMPDGSIEGGQRTLQLRVTPTDDGWKIAEIDLVAETTFDRPPRPPEPPTDERPQRRNVAKKITDFPEAPDLSTPESACAAYHRASARMDAQAVVDLSWVKIDPAEMRRFWERAGPEDLAIYNPAQLEAEILEVLVYRGRLAAVISRLAFPPGKGRHPYSRRSFGLIDGQWKNLGEDRLPSLEAAVAGFLETKDRLWEHFREIEAAVLAERARAGRTVRKARRTAPVAVTVTSGGKPVEGATVMLIPRAPDGSPASGQTDAAGKAVLTTTEQGDGVIPGTYGVTISKVVTEQKGTGTELRHLVPRRFAVPEASGLTVEVAESANDFTFDLPGVEEAPPTTGASKGNRR